MPLLVPWLRVTSRRGQQSEHRPQTTSRVSTLLRGQEKNALISHENNYERLVPRVRRVAQAPGSSERALDSLPHFTPPHTLHPFPLSLALRFQNSPGETEPPSTQHTVWAPALGWGSCVLGLFPGPMPTFLLKRDYQRS